MAGISGYWMSISMVCISSGHEGKAYGDIPAMRAPGASRVPQHRAPYITQTPATKKRKARRRARSTRVRAACSGFVLTQRSSACCTGYTCGNLSVCTCETFSHASISAARTDPGEVYDHQWEVQDAGARCSLHLSIAMDSFYSLFPGVVRPRNAN